MLTLPFSRSVMQITPTRPKACLDSWFLDVSDDRSLEIGGRRK
jgi:hypothetical protein